MPRASDCQWLSVWPTVSLNARGKVSAACGCLPAVGRCCWRWKTRLPCLDNCAGHGVSAAKSSAAAGYPPHKRMPMLRGLHIILGNAKGQNRTRPPRGQRHVQTACRVRYAGQKIDRPRSRNGQNHASRLPYGKMLGHLRHAQTPARLGRAGAWLSGWVAMYCYDVQCGQTMAAFRAHAHAAPICRAGTQGCARSGRSAAPHSPASEAHRRGC